MNPIIKIYRILQQKKSFEDYIEFDVSDILIDRFIYWCYVDVKKLRER